MPVTFADAKIVMNPDLNKLQPYPFQKLAALFREVTPNKDYRAISLSIGEPKHATPQFIKDAITDNLAGLSNYPTTAGSDALRGTIADHDADLHTQLVDRFNLLGVRGDDV